jgi:serine/threonine-protein kinase
MTLARLVALTVLVSVGPTVRPSAAQCPDGSAPPCSRSRPASPHSVAVLYFRNLSGDSTVAYLADGLTEELAAKLAEMPRLQVRSVFSVRRYRGLPRIVPASIGQTLAVTFLVTGTVRPASDRIRVTIELIRASNGARVWGRVFDRPRADPLGVTAEIAREISVEVGGRLLPRELAILAQRQTSSQQAYDHFLKGNYFLAQRSPRSGTRAIHEYEEAVRLDPAYTAAFGKLALTYALARSNVWDVGLPPDTLRSRARAAAALVATRDSLNTDVLVARVLLDGDFERESWDRAIVRDPDNPELQHIYGLRLALAGDRSGAVAALHRAVDIDPDRPITLGWLSALAVADARFPEAKRWADSALALNPLFPGYAHRALIHLQLGDTSGARNDAAAAVRASAGSRVGDASLALVTIATGDSTGGRIKLQELLGPDPRASLPNDEARAYAIAALGLLGDTARALDLLERPYPNRYVALLAPLAVFDPLRALPRFQRLVDQSRPPGRVP